MKFKSPTTPGAIIRFHQKHFALDFFAKNSFFRSSTHANRVVVIFLCALLDLTMSYKGIDHKFPWKLCAKIKQKKIW